MRSRLAEDDLAAFVHESELERLVFTLAEAKEQAYAGWVATLAGWYVTEIGRQPWLVTGVLRTHEALGPVPAGQVGFTLAVYLALYLVLLVTYIGVLVHLALKAGKEGDPEPSPAVDNRALSQPVQAGE